MREAVSPYAGRLVLAVACMVAVAATTAALAWLMDPVVNRVFVDQRADLLWPVGGAVLTVFVVKGLATYCQTVLMAGVGQSVLMDMQNRLFRHLMTQDLSFFQHQTTGGLMSRFTTDIGMMRQAVSTALTGVGKDSLSVIFLVGVMFYQDWLLATIAFAVFPATVIPITTLGRRLRHVTADTQAQTGSLMTLLQQTFTGMRLIKSYRMEAYETERAATLTERIRSLVVRTERVKAIASPLMETFGGVAVTTVIVYGGWRVIQETTTAGAFFSFLTALLMAYRPMKALANLNAQVQEGLAGAERLFYILDTEPSLKDSVDAKPLVVGGGGIALDTVSFSYDEDTAALNSVTFDVPAGKTTALVGQSGAGKTTVLNLIPRFYDLHSGRIAIDGQDIRKVTLASLRDATSLVSQDVVLFDDTVRANVRFGKPDASDQEIEAAITSAGANGFVQNLPQGLDTMVGERGQSLSGGERQRIAIARAILKDAPILLLDEATSALDMETERYVQSAIETLCQNRTTVVIAHRLSTVHNADVIHVLNGGQVIESGTHAELIEKGGDYAKLYALQFAETER